MKALRISIFSGFEMKSPNNRLSNLVHPFKKAARLRAFEISGDKSPYMRPFSSRNARPVFGFELNRAAPVNISFFWDFVCKRECGVGNSCEIQVISTIYTIESKTLTEGHDSIAWMRRQN
jgi:hypothetical protein